MEKPDTKRNVVLGGTFLILTGLLLWSRLVGLDLSFWHDEVVTVTRYAGQGPQAIFFSPYIPNNHVLFEILAWATSRILGTSEITYRLWSVLPAMAGSAWLTWWAFRRFGTLVGSTVGVLIVVAPLLMALSREARGYGLALLAMTGLITQADSALRNPDGSGIWRFAIFGLVGVLTLPVFVLPFVLAALPLLLEPKVRSRLIAAGIAAGILALVWYWPMLPELVESTSQEFGRPVPWHGFATLSLSQLVFPVFRLLLSGVPNIMLANSNDPLIATIVWHAVAWTLLTVGGLWLWRRDQRLLFGSLALPVVGTYLALAMSGMWVVNRFVSYLSLPLFVLMALGIRGLVELIPRRGRRLAHISLAALAVWLLISFYPVAEQVTRLPLEALKDASQLANESGADLLVTNSVRPEGFRYYLETPPEIMDVGDLESMFCSEKTGYVFLEHHPVESEPVDTSCLRLKGATRSRFDQRIRGGHIDVWLVGLPETEPTT